MDATKVNILNEVELSTKDRKAICVKIGVAFTYALYAFFFTFLLIIICILIFVLIFGLIKGHSELIGDALIKIISSSLGTIKNVIFLTFIFGAIIAHKDIYDLISNKKFQIESIYYDIESESPAKLKKLNFITFIMFPESKILLFDGLANKIDSSAPVYVEVSKHGRLLLKLKQQNLNWVNDIDYHFNFFRKDSFNKRRVYQETNAGS